MVTATMEISPSDQQWQAIRCAGTWVQGGAAKPVFYLAGYAGSGKTTIIPEIVDIVNLDPFQDVVFCAPTGKAARVHATGDTGEPMVVPVQDEVTGDISLAPIRAYRGLFDEHQYRRKGAIDGNERFAYFKSKELEHFDFGWAVTCHKAQGSQWPEVLVWDESFVFRDQWKRWLYTAITRAEERLTLVTG